MDKMEAVAKDIIELKFKPKQTIAEVIEMFYALMRKHGITQVTKVEGSLQGDNFEWTMCRTLFWDRFVADIEWKMCFTKTKKEFIKNPTKAK